MSVASPLARTSAATAALGAAIIGIGVGGPLLRGAPTPLGPGACALVLVVASVQAVWAVAALRATRAPRGRVCVTATCVVAAGWLLAAGGSPAGAHGGRVSALLAAALCAACAAGLLVSRRTAAASLEVADEASAWAQLAVLVPVAVLVASAVTAGLAAGPAGDGAMNHMAGM